MSDTGPSRPTQPALPPGTGRIDPEHRFGKFIRTQVLGVGGMGEVWKAWDAQIGRWVALKFLKAADAEMTARFQREALVAARLIHPHIGAIYEFGQERGTRFIAMQLIDGKSPRGPMPAKKAAALVRDAARAVQFAHDNGVVHRDLKPDNLMISSSGHVFVMDFGLARPIDADSEISRTGMLIGTPDYMPPEQARAEELDVRADVFSLGATLYELVSGAKPYRGTGMLDTLRKVVEEDPPPLKNLDPDLATILHKCLEKERERRYAGAADLADDLERWLAGDSIRAKPATIRRQLQKKLSSSWIPLAIVVACLVAIAGGVAIFASMGKTEKAKTLREETAKKEAEKSQAAMQELNAQIARIATAREWRRQAFRKPGDIVAEFRGAESDCSRFIARYPALAQGPYARALVRVELHDPDGARSDLEKAIALESNFGPGLMLKVRVMLYEYLETHYLTDVLRISRSKEFNAQLAQVEATLAKAKSADMTSWGLNRTADDEVSETITRVLVEWILEKKIEPALHRLRLAEEAKPSEEYCRMLGHLAEGESKEWFEQAVAIAPHYDLAIYDRGALRAEQGNVDGAVEDYNRALAIWPQNHKALAMRGMAHDIRDRFKEALADLDRAIDLAPDRPDYYCSRGQVRSNADDVEGALADFSKAIALLPALGEAWFGRGNQHQKLDHLEEALSDYTESIRLRPKDPDGYANRGTAYHRKGEVPSAAADYEKALKLAPRNWPLREALQKWLKDHPERKN